MFGKYLCILFLVSDYDILIYIKTFTEHLEHLDLVLGILAQPKLYSPLPVLCDAIQLCNALATFQALMNKLFGNYLFMFFLVFFYDILIYSRSFPELLVRLDLVLDILEQHKLYTKEAKCEFAKTSFKYLAILSLCMLFVLILQIFDLFKSGQCVQPSRSLEDFWA